MGRYINFNDYFTKIFGGKVVKLSLDGGCSCPNRDGTLSTKGCIFCSERGSGDFAANPKDSILNQIESQKSLLKKWNGKYFIAYFQNFTNTYGDISRLKNLYNSVLEIPGIVGISIATRCDCLGDDVLDLLCALNRKTFLWLELGMQSSNENTIKLINRGYSHKIFDERARELKKLGIKFLPHVIFGLPYETKSDMVNSIEYVKDLNPFGIKIQSLYIQSDSPLYNFYLEKKFPLLSKEEYVHLVCDAIESIPKEIVYHRLTGDADRSKLIAPKWSADKLSVLSSIEKELKSRGLPLL